jgi:hypothetical protein
LEFALDSTWPNLLATCAGPTMSDDEQFPGTEILAEGEENVVAFLLSVGVPDFGIDGYLELEMGIGRWPSGRLLEEGEGGTETLIATVTLDSAGVYRIERGPADLFWELNNPPDDEDDG